MKIHFGSSLLRRKSFNSPRSLRLRAGNSQRWGEFRLLWGPHNKEARNCRARERNSLASLRGWPNTNIIRSRPPSVPFSLNMEPSYQLRYNCQVIGTGPARTLIWCIGACNDQTLFRHLPRSSTVLISTDRLFKRN